MSRTVNQVERAKRIKRQMNDELDLVAQSFRSVGRAVFTPCEEAVLGQQVVGHFVSGLSRG